MCGRYVTARSASELRALFDAADETGGGLRADFNVAPTTDVPTVIATREPAEAGDGRGQVRGRLRLLRWGLLPRWAKDMEAGARMIDARVETVEDKPASRRAFASRRCLLPADGCYEWLPPDGRGGSKQPIYFSRADGAPLAMAGLYERWTSPTGEQLLSCVVLITTAMDEFRHVHDPQQLSCLTPATTRALVPADAIH